MNNITILIGPKGSGKQEKAKQIAASYQPEEVVFLKSIPGIYHYFINYFFAECTAQTKLLVVSNLENKDEIFSFIFFLGSGHFGKQENERTLLVEY